MSSQTIESPTVVQVPHEIDAPGWMVTVYNNDVNTYQQVMTVLIIATGCHVEEAYTEAWEIDHLGFSNVHFGDEDECRRAAKIISSIGIHVEVRQEP